MVEGIQSIERFNEENKGSFLNFENLDIRDSERSEL